MLDDELTFPVNWFSKIDRVLVVDKMHQNGADFMDLLFLQWSFGLQSKRGTHTFVV